MFYCQPLATRFGTDLIGHIASGNWDKLDLAVAWVRASGIAHLEPTLRTFLASGKTLTAIVGIDFDNTTKEGLASLLALKSHGKVTVFVHHNEAGTIFHPKLYLLRSATSAKLIVGSNNLTEAGLYQNTEAGLELDASIDDPVVASALDALLAWRDASMGLARELDGAFLQQLVANGYVHDEASVRAQSAKRRQAARAKSGTATKLFGSVPVTPPTKPAPAVPKLKQPIPGKKPQGKPASKPPATPSQVGTPGTTVTGQVLLMRLRKAHVTDRPTQTQIPKRVANTPFFGSIASVLSSHSGSTHDVLEASARGIVNTLKLEIPEMRTMSDPVARFERTPTGIRYEVYDSHSAQGKAIMNALKSGRTSSPPTTQLTLPSNPSSATWWRFI